MITIGEIEKGMKVTILEWTNSGDRSWVGDELHVLAVQPPFVKVRIHKDCFGLRDGDPLTLNTNEVVLMELNEEFTNPSTT